MLGNANGAGEENRNVGPDGRAAGRAAGLGAGLDREPALRVQPGRRDGRVPDDRDRRRGRRRHRRGRVDDPGALGAAQAGQAVPDRQPAPRCPPRSAGGWSTRRCRPEWTVSLGEACEQLGEKHGISRERQDAFALRSHQLADRAWADGFYKDLVAPVPDTGLERDEGIRPGSTPEKLASLRPSFRPNGTITAGNASPLNDGASAVLLGSAGGRGRDRPRPGGPDRRPRGDGAGAAGLRLRAGGGGEPGAGPGRHRLVRRGRGRAQRGVRGAVAGLPGRLADRPGDRQHPRRRDRDRAPARRVRRPDPRHAGRGACGPTGTAGASPRSASASARASRWCWRTPDDRGPRRPGRGRRRHPGRRDRADRRVRPGRAADRAHRRAAPARAPATSPWSTTTPATATPGWPRCSPPASVRKIICSFPRQSRLLGLRRALPVREDRAGAGAAGQPGRADAGRRRRHRRVLLPDRRRHAAGRGQGAAHHRRPRVRAGVSRSRATSRSSRRTGPTRSATSSTARPPATSAR